MVYVIFFIFKVLSENKIGKCRKIRYSCELRVKVGVVTLQVLGLVKDLAHTLTLITIVQYYIIT